jgi:hypothetical protein
VRKIKKYLATKLSNKENNYDGSKSRIAEYIQEIHFAVELKILYLLGVFKTELILNFIKL